MLIDTGKFSHIKHSTVYTLSARLGWSVRRLISQSVNRSPSRPLRFARSACRQRLQRRTPKTPFVKPSKVRQKCALLSLLTAAACNLQAILHTRCLLVSAKVQTLQHQQDIFDRRLHSWGDVQLMQLVKRSPTDRPTDQQAQRPLSEKQLKRTTITIAISPSQSHQHRASSSSST